MNVEQAWQSVLGQLQMEMPRASFDTWVRDTRPVKYENGLMTITVRNAYARDWLESRLASTVNRLLIGIMDSNVSVNFVVSQNDDEMSQSVESVEQNDNSSPVSLQRNITLNPRYTFENFVVGSGNRLAHAACLAVAASVSCSWAGSSSPSPLFMAVN